jgi:penicillin-binding protein-related factor A (putative recombinase)
MLTSNHTFTVARVQVVIKDIFDIQEYRGLQYLEEHDQVNNVAFQFLLNSKQSTIFVTKISRLIKFTAKERNVMAALSNEPCCTVTVRPTA